MRNLNEVKTLLGEILNSGKPPLRSAAADDYQKLTLLKDIKMSDALSRLTPPLSVQEGIEFNFDSTDPDEWMSFVILIAQGDCTWMPDGPTDAQGYVGCFMWVPADRKLTDPADDGVALEPPPAPRDSGQRVLAAFPEKRQTTSFFAPRRQPGSFESIATVDVGFKAGDILLTHHPQDRFIADITTSWPTHAGMAINERWAVDANAYDDQAVKVLPMSGERSTLGSSPPGFPEGFFEDRPEGGLVYRFVGDGTKTESELDEIRRTAAEWAFGEAKNKYRFALEHSKIVDGSKRGKPFVEKKFDDEGKAVGDDGQRYRYYKRSKGEWKESEQHNIYCAELVWRAYRHAGVNIVDPKDLDLLTDLKQAVPAILVYKVMGGEISDGMKKGLKALKLLRPGPARYMAAKRMRKIYHNKLLFCAPYQLASTPQTEKFGQIAATMDDFDTIEFTDYKANNIHPYDVVREFGAEEDEIEEKIKADRTARIRAGRKRNRSQVIREEVRVFMEGGTADAQIQSEMNMNRLSEKKARRVVEKSARTQLEDLYDQDTEQLIVDATDDIPEEEIEAYPRTKLKATEISLSVTKPWATAEDEEAPEIKLILDPDDEDDVYHRPVEFRIKPPHALRTNIQIP